MIGPGSSCGACKFLRRKCTSECVFAPYFCYDLAPTHFAAVHKVFGTSNVSKMLLQLPVNNRRHAAMSIAYEALARLEDPVYGCVAHILALQQQVVNLQDEIDYLVSQMPNLATWVHPGNEDLQATATLSSYEKTEFSMQSDMRSSLYHQENPTALPKNPGFSAANSQTPCHQNNDAFLSPDKWPEENFLNDTVANLAGEGFMSPGNEINSAGNWLEGPTWW